MQMQKMKKLASIQKKQHIKKKDGNKYILLEYMGDIDDKLFKKYSNGKIFNSFINQFDHATNEEGKEEAVKELKDINDIVKHDIETDEDSEHIQKLFFV